MHHIALPSRTANAQCTKSVETNRGRGMEQTHGSVEHCRYRQELVCIFDMIKWSKGYRSCICKTNQPTPVSVLRWCSNAFHLCRYTTASAKRFEGGVVYDSATNSLTAQVTGSANETVTVCAVQTSNNELVCESQHFADAGTQAVVLKAQ